MNKFWNSVIAPRPLNMQGELAFSDFDCVSSTLTVIESGLAEKINFGIVLVWDKKEEMWTNFYNWHCWAVTKEGQPVDLSLHLWNRIFTMNKPPIMPEKDPLLMSCEISNAWGKKNIYERTLSKAEIIYINGALTTQSLIPPMVKKLILLSGKEEGLAYQEATNLIFQ